MPVRKETAPSSFRKAILLRETWGHMSAVSGFDPLFTAISSLPGVSTSSLYVASTSPVPSFLQKLLSLFGLRPTAKRNDPPDPSYMEKRHVLAAQELLLRANKDTDSLVFLSAAENQYCSHLSKADASIRSRLVLCLHQPPAWFRAHWPDFSVFDGLRALVCLSEEQRKFFSQITSTPAVFIRHGVRHDFFVPAEQIQKSSPRLLFVGQWLRDFATLLKTMHEVWQSQPELELDCVIPLSVRINPELMELAKDERVRWYAGIEPEALLELYQNATLLLLPLTASAANNAILEAVACGLPVVTTDVGGAREYVPKEAATLCPPGDINAHASAVLQWLENDEKRKAATKICRIFVEQKHDWAAIAKKLSAAVGLLPDVN